jgi:UDP-N-acetylmuramyl pentapeptide phosphotransferase/UDP-N-acetylglucosamine-1-phosphate transferase
LAGWRADPVIWILLGGTAAVAGVGLWDDLRNLSVLPRLSAQAAVAIAVVWTLGGLDRLPLPGFTIATTGWIGLSLAVLWLVAVTNFFNFMDGADGLAGGQAVLSLGLAGWALWPVPASAVALTGMAATAAFLTRNWAPARIFLGDVGSSWLGFLLAALPLAGPLERRADLVLLMAVSLTLFLLDPIATLVRRTRRGAPLGQAHREHAYQRLFDPGERHSAAVDKLLAAAAVLSLLAAVGYARPDLGWWVIGAAVAVFVVEWRAAGRRRPPRVPQPAD